MNIVTLHNTRVVAYMLDMRDKDQIRYSINRRLIYKEHTSTKAQGTDPRVALGA